jgi:hypothetical protein
MSDTPRANGSVAPQRHPSPVQRLSNRPVDSANA